MEPVDALFVVHLAIDLVDDAVMPLSTRQLQPMVIGGYVGGTGLIKQQHRRARGACPDPTLHHPAPPRPGTSTVHRCMGPYPEYGKQVLQTEGEHW